MLLESEIKRLMKKENPIMADENIVKEAEKWSLGWKISPRLIGTIYSFMKHKYETGATLNDMEKITGIACEAISYALRELESHGYLAISRASKPFRYRVIK